jgi:hypothetical protein
MKDISRGSAIKPLRAHDYPDLTAHPQVPNVKALQRIMAGFIAAAGFCLAMCILFVVRDAHVPRAALYSTAPHCKCTGQCMRKGAR